MPPVGPRRSAPPADGDSLGLGLRDVEDDPCREDVEALIERIVGDKILDCIEWEAIHARTSMNSLKKEREMSVARKGR